MGYQWLGRMPYLSKTRHGIYRYRRTIPPALREAAGRREWNKSLQTRDPQEAKQLWAAVNLEFEQYLSDLQTYSKSSNSEAPLDVQQRVGRDFLKRHGLTHKSFAELKAMHEEHGNLREPSEFEKRREFVEDKLDIAMDDEHGRDEAIHRSPEARAVLGTLSPQRYLLTEAMQGYFAEKGYDLGDRSRSADRNNRLLVERVIAGLRKTLGDDASVEDVSRDHAVQYRDALLAEEKAAGRFKETYWRCQSSVTGRHRQS